MQVAELDVRNRSGLHARPAATFVKTAAAFRSKVSIENLTRGSKPANAKSLLSRAGVRRREGPSDPGLGRGRGRGGCHRSGAQAGRRRLRRSPQG